MVIDMLNTEAVIALTAGAVTELQFRMVHICSAADRAFVGIELALLFIADSCRFLAEVYCALAGLPGHKSFQVAGAEDEEVKQRHQRQQIYGEGIAQHGKQEKDRINNGKKLHLNGNDEHEQHLHIRIHRRKGEEHRKIDIA